MKAENSKAQRGQKMCRKLQIKISSEHDICRGVKDPIGHVDTCEERVPGTGNSQSEHPKE